MQDITIVGGGVIGLSCAYYLQRTGYSVTIIDKSNITHGCSFVNMGFISPSHFMPLASPGVIAEGLRYLLNSSSPFYIKPRLDISLLKWTHHFWKKSKMAIAIRNAMHLHTILQLSRLLINEMKESLNDTFGMEEKGCLMLCQKRQSWEDEILLADEAANLGLSVAILNAEQTQQLEPEIELNIKGSVLFKDDCHYHPQKMMLALKEYLIQKGVQFKLHTTVTGFEKNNGKIAAIITDKGKLTVNEVIIAAGSWLPKLAKMLNIDLLLQPGKGYSYTYDHVEKNIQYPAILVDGRCAISPWDNQLRIGGTMEFSGHNDKIHHKRMVGIYRSVKSFYPGLEIAHPPTDKIVQGLRPVTPDGLPYIGRHSSFKNVIFAGGHAMLGMSQATGTGLLVSELVQRKTTSIDISAFKVERFDNQISPTS